MLVWVRLLFITAAAQVLLAIPGGYLSFDVVFQSADTIVAGTVVSGSVSAESFQIVLAVDRTFKGTAPVGAIKVSGDLPKMIMVNADGPISNRDRGLWFLRHQPGSNVWTAIPLQSGRIREHYYWLPASQSVEAVASSSTVAGQIVGTVADAISTGNRNDEDLLRLLSALRDYSAPDIDPIFLRLFRGSSARGKVLATARLLKKNDTAAIIEAARLLRLDTTSYDQKALIDGIYELRTADGKAVEALGELALAPSVNQFVRRATGFAVSRNHIAQALPFLARLLDSEDKFVREAAVAGFGNFTAEIPVAAGDEQRNELMSKYVIDRVVLKGRPFLKYESADTIRHFHRGWKSDSERDRQVIQFWKGWWAANKASILAQP